MWASVKVVGCTSARNCESDNLLIEGPMVCIDQLDQNLVRSRREAINDDRYAARVCPVPGGVIDRHMDVPKPGSHGKCGRPEYRQDVQILRVIGKKQNATRQWLGLRSVDDELCGWFALRRVNSGHAMGCVHEIGRAPGRVTT